MGRLGCDADGLLRNRLPHCGCFVGKKEEIRVGCLRYVIISMDVEGWSRSWSRSCNYKDLHAPRAIMPVKHPIPLVFLLSRSA